MSQWAENSKVEVVKRRRVKKLHSSSCWDVEKELLSGFPKDQDPCYLQVPKKTRKRRVKHRKKKGKSRIAKISKGLSDILRIYDASDSENTQSNTSCTDISTFDDSFSSISDMSVPAKNELCLHSEVEISEKAIERVAEKPKIQILKGFKRGQSAKL